MIIIKSSKHLFSHQFSNTFCKELFAFQIISPFKSILFCFAGVYKKTKYIIVLITALLKKQMFLIRVYMWHNYIPCKAYPAVQYLASRVNPKWQSENRIRTMTPWYLLQIILCGKNVILPLFCQAAAATDKSTKCNIIFCLSPQNSDSTSLLSLSFSMMYDTSIVWPQLLLIIA